jgi:hypothetical protein
MNLLARRAKPQQPRHVEIWGEMEDNNRFLRRVAAATSALAFLGMALGAYGLEMGLTRPLAFHVDADGVATFAGHLHEQVAPSEVEVRYVGKEFLKRYIAFNSLTIESDFADAWKLMTESLRKEHAELLAQYEKDHGEELVAFVKKQKIQSVLEFDAKRTEVRDHNGKTFTVKLRGTARTWPLNRPTEDAAFQEKEFEAVLTLVRCPRTEETPNGLLVHHVAQHFFEVEKSDLAPVDPHLKEKAR